MPQINRARYVSANRRPLLGLIGSQIVGGHQSGIGVAAHGRRDIGGDRAAIERRGASRRDRAQRFGEDWIAQRRARRRSGMAGAQKVVARRRLAREPVCVGRDRRREPRRDGETLLGKRYRRRYQIGPRQTAEAGMYRFQNLDRPGHPDRAAAEHGIVERHRFAGLIEEQIGLCRLGRCLAPVPRRDAMRGAVVMQDERPTAETGRLGFDKGQDHLHRNRGIGSRAAGAQHRKSGLDRPPVGGRHHLMLRRRRFATRRADGRQGGRQGGREGEGPKDLAHGVAPSVVNSEARVREFRIQVDTSARFLNAVERDAPADKLIEAVVETFFSALTRQRIRRGSFHSIVELQAAIRRYLAQIASSSLQGDGR